MRHFALLSIVVLTAAGCRFQTPTVQPARPGENGLPQASWVRIYFWDFDRVATAAQLRPLRAVTLPEGRREVRIWIGGGIGYPQELYRFTDDGRRVRGEYILYWPAPPADTSEGETPGETFHEIMILGQAGRCGGFRRSADTGICRALFTREPDWRAVLQRAEAGGLWTLPDESTLPGNVPMVLDGTSMTVELRDGRTYRAYQYDVPNRRGAPESERITEIARSLNAIDSLLRTPDSERTYRGITSGRYRSEFRDCASGDRWQFDDDLAHMANSAGIPFVHGSDTTARYVVEVIGQLTPEWLARQFEAKYPKVLQPLRLVALQPSVDGACPPARR